MGSLRTCVVLFAYQDAAAVRRILPEILASRVDQVIVAIEGDPGLQRELEGAGDPRVAVSYSPERLGKARAYNRALLLVPECDLVFLVSADVTFERSIFETLSRAFLDPAVGVALPCVVPQNISGGVTRIGRVLWDVHDAQLACLNQEAESIHGGELLSLRRELLTPLPEDTVNEDAWLCIAAVRRGFRCAYLRDARVGNRVPVTWKDFLRQRRRVNYGHLQLARSGMPPKVLNRMFPDDLNRGVPILLRLLAEHPEDTPYLPLAVLAELFSMFLGRLDLLDGRAHAQWTMVRREVPSPADQR